MGFAMDRNNGTGIVHPRCRRPAAKRWLTGLLILLGLGLSGCSIGVMAGRLLTGDPKLPAAFRNMTKVDLTKGDHKVLVICSAPEFIQTNYSSLELDLIDGVTRRMKSQGVAVIEPDKVARWIDDRGGRWDSLTELADDFDADYIVRIDLETFTYREPNSPKLLRGSSSGLVTAYEVKQIGGKATTQQVFVNAFNSTYPNHMPVSEESRSEKVFRKEYLDRITEQLAQMFYDYRPEAAI